MSFKMKKSELITKCTGKRSMHLSCAILVCFLCIGCEKRSVEPMDEKYVTPSLELSNNGKLVVVKSKQPSDAGWADSYKDPTRLRPSIADVIVKQGFGFVMSSHTEEGEIKNVQLNRLLQDLYGKQGKKHTFKEVRAKNFLVGKTKNGSLINAQFVEMHYFEDKERRIFGLKTIFGHQPGGVNEYGKGINYLLENGPYYKPTNNYLHSGTQQRVYVGYHKQMSHNIHYSLPPNNNIKFYYDGVGSNQGHSANNDGSTGGQGSNNGLGD